MTQDVTRWEKDWGLMECFFNDKEIKSIRKKIQALKIKHVVVCSFESRFARSGGLAAVTTKILPYLNEIKQVQQVLLMTPFYPHIMNETKLTPTGITFKVMYDNKSIKVKLLKCTSPALSSNRRDVKEYYLKANGFFDAKNKIHDPYGYYPEDPQKNDAAIRYNALFFCKAVPLAVQVLGLQEDIVFHLQEWQTALIALTAKEAMLNGTLFSCGTVQTLHNAFDSWISTGMLAKLTDNQRIHEHSGIRDQGGITALQMGLQLVDAPITTVSDHFAEELTTDLLQSDHFAPHLQEIFRKNGVYGINNGLFTDFPPEYSPKQNDTIQEIKKIKQEKRKKVLKILDTFHPAERFGHLTYRSKSITQLPNKVPILVMSGRLDPFQKGFDLFLQAVEKFREDEIKVVLTPMPVKTSDLDYFHEVAFKCRGNITIFPIRMEKGYHELQMGSTFGMMPSIYEPFGAAIEYMVSGTVTIARETGGLKDQVRHKTSGFLFREKPEFYTMENINAFSQSCDTVQLRKYNQWAVSIVNELYEVIKEAIDLYQNHQNDYYRLILEGFKQARTFTWQKAAEKYLTIYEKIKSV
jgi:glycogen synthase